MQQLIVGTASERLGEINDKRRCSSRVALRFGSASQTFEFVLPEDTVSRWPLVMSARPAFAQAVGA